MKVLRLTAATSSRRRSLSEARALSPVSSSSYKARAWAGEFKGVRAVRPAGVRWFRRVDSMTHHTRPTECACGMAASAMVAATPS